MTGFRACLLSVSAVFVGGAAALACENCYPAYGYSYGPAYAMPAYGMAPVAPRPNCPCPVAAPVRSACPTPAPSSPGPTALSTNEPPLGVKPGKGPTISQSRTFSGVPQTTEPRTAMCKVSFWNLSGTDVTLMVGERSQAIPKDRAVIIDLDRNFSWRTNFHTAKTEEIADDVNHFEVMIR